MVISDTKKPLYSRLLKNIKGKNIYIQGAEGKFSYIFIPVKATIGMNEIYSIDYGAFFTHIKNNYITNYIIKDKMKKIVDYFLQQQQQNPRFVDEIEETWKNSCTSFYELISEVSSMNLKETSLPTLINIYQKIAEKGYQQWKPLIFIDAFDPFGEELLEKEIAQQNLPFHNKINILTFPSEMSYAQKEKLDLLKIASFVLKNNLVSSLVRKQSVQDFQDIPPQVYLLLKKHEKQYYWSKNNYAHIIYSDANIFFKELQNIVKENNLEIIEEQIYKIKTDFEKKNAERNSLLKQLPEKIHNFIYFFQRLTELRDKRKQNNCILLTWLKLFSQEIAIKLSIEPKLLDNVIWWELEQLLKNKEGYLELLKKREDESMIIFFNTSQQIILTGKEATDTKHILEEKIMKQCSELTGKIASQGKAKGVVRIIQKVGEFGKFHRGDILITAMTRPEFLPIMEKAAAIITDEGGITSHAAIVSRELGIPCIIGTQIATKVLSDGEYIEVDAFKGVVKRCSQKKSC